MKKIIVVLVAIMVIPLFTNAEDWKLHDHKLISTGSGYYPCEVEIDENVTIFLFFIGEEAYKKSELIEKALRRKEALTIIGERKLEGEAWEYAQISISPEKFRIMDFSIPGINPEMGRFIRIILINNTEGFMNAFEGKAEKTDFYITE